MKSPLKRALVNLLVALLVLEPFSFALAGGITVAPGAPASKTPTMESAPNGVPIVNIVKPNASGLSHNQFDQFNVSPKGVIINNSSKPGVSQLGGAIYGNSNFGGGPEARLILNEVTGGSRSSIEGYTEIFGYAARYILANPNGISVNGGGFINTPRATLTTGTPRLDGAGGLQSLDVRRGDVLIDGQGVNAANIDAFDIVTRAARVNAAIYARQLRIATGYGDYAPGAGTFSPAALDGSTPPAVAIDSTALGGMYADRITLVGNEKGVGVNLLGAVRATDSLTLTADGKIQIAGAVSADKDASAASGSDAVEISGKFGAGGAANVHAAQGVLLASAAGGDAPLLYGKTVHIAADKLTNSDGKIAADTTLSATTTGDMTNAGTIYAGTDAALNVGGALNNSGQIEAKGALTATGQGGVSNSGTMQSGGDLLARSGADLANTGTLSAQGLLGTDIAGTLDNSGALYAAKGGTIGAGSLANRSGGQIITLGDALFTLGGTFGNAGTINAGGQATVRSAGSLRNESTGQVLAQTAINLDSQADIENLGTVNSGGTSAYAAAGLLHNAGTFSSATGTTLAAANLVNDATGQILFQGDGGLTVGGDVTNAGLVYSGGKGTYRVGGVLLNNRGQLLSQGDMLLEGLASGSRMTRLQNDSGGIESLNGALTVRAQTVANNNLDFKLEEGAIAGDVLSGGLHSYGNDSWGVSSIYGWATGHGIPGQFQWNAGRIRVWQVQALGLDSTRNVFSRTELIAAADKIEQELAVTPDATRKSSIDSLRSGFVASGSPYFVLILNGQRGEIAVYEAHTATDRATGMDKGGSLAAATSLAVEADQFTNTVSKVSTASGDITINAASFENTGKDLYQRDTVNWGRGFTNNSKHKGVYSEGYGQETTLTPVGYAYGTISSGGKVAITAAHVSNGISENAGAATSGAGAAIIAPVKPGSLARAVPSLTDLIGTLPSTGLFSTNTAPGHHYLVETNPALTNMSTFYGSDYFLKRAGIDLDKSNMQLLGDAYYETKLVREQILALTGKRLLSSTATSDAEQMQALMDSALRAKSSLDLTVGVALTQDQIANLTEDIVWLEKTVVDGHEVLVPKVYLASKSVETIAKGGSVIVGKDVAVTTTGDTKNSGVLLAENTLTLNAANVLNSGGTLGGQTVTVAATDSIANMSGTITGKDVTLSAGKSIAVGTTATTFASATTTSEAVGRRGEVAATGSLNMTAGNSITISGADVSAGGAANLTAGNTVSIAAQTLNNTTDVASSHNNYKSHNANVANLGSTLTSGGALAITAGQDVNVAGSTVAAGGDAAITAGRNVTIASATDSQEFSRHLEGKDGGFFGGKSSESASGSSTTNVAAKVTSGGALTVQAGAAGSGDLVVSGSKAASTHDMSLKAAGDVLVASAQEQSDSSSSSSSSGLLSSKSKQQTSHTLTQVGSEITSGGAVDMEGRSGVTVSASTVQGQGDVTLKSDSGDVRVLAAQNESSSTYSQKKSGIGLFVGNGRIDVAQFKEASSKTSESGNVGSTVASNQNVALQSGNDASVVGSDVSASKDVTITAARDVNVTPGRNARQSESKSKSGGIGIGYSLAENEAGLSIGLKNTEQGMNSSGQYNAKSTIGAGSNVTVQAGRNVNQVSSDITAGQNVKITAGQDVNVKAAQDVEHLDQYEKQTEAGVSLAVRQSVTNAVRTVAQLPTSATAGKGNPAAQGVTAISAGEKAVASVRQAFDSTVSGSLTAGLSMSESHSSSDSATSVSSSTSAGGSVEQTAGRDITLAGAQVQADKNVTLTAGRDAAITAAQNQYSSSQSSSSASASAGIGASTGMNGPSAGYQLSASLSGSDGNSRSDTNTNAVVSAGETLSVKTGQDATVAGAHMVGKDVKMDVGRDLTVASIQDTSSSSNSSYSVGGTVTVGPKPDIVSRNVSPQTQLGQTGNSGSFSVGSGSSSSSWVNGQTSVIGTNSVDIRTEKNTDVEGAVIASGTGNLKLDTGTLTYKDISDHDTGSNTNVGVSVPLGSAIGGDKAPAPQTDSQKDAPGALEKFLEASTLDTSYDSHDRRQVDRATIGEGTITVRSNPDQDLTTLNRDPNKAQEITKDERTKANLSLDGAAIAEVLSGFKGTRENFQKLHDLLIKTELTDDDKRIFAMTLKEFTDRELIAPESAAGAIAYANLSKEQRLKADENLNTILNLGDPNNNPAMGAFIDSLTIEERLNIVYSAQFRKQDAATSQAMLAAILGVDVYNQQARNVFQIDDASRDTSKFLPNIVVNELDKIANADVSFLENKKSEIVNAVSVYENANSEESRLKAIGDLTHKIANAIGMNNININTESTAVDNSILYVRVHTRTPVPFLGLFTFFQHTDVTADTVTIPADSILLKHPDEMSKEEIVGTIVHELTHIQQSSIVDNYLNGRDKTTRGALLTAGYIYGGVKPSSGVGLYRAMPQEAEAYHVGSKVADTLKNTRFFQ